MTRLGRRMLAAVLPADVRSAVIDDLDAEYERTIRPVRGRLRAAAWYWRQVVGSLAPALAMRLRRRERWSAAIAHDGRFALRMLLRYPGFSAAVVATLALGIGASSAVISLVDGLLIRPLPYTGPERLVRIWSSNPRGIARAAVAPADFFDWRERVATFESMAAYAEDDLTVTGRGEPIRVRSALATANLTATLGVSPLLGRWFAPTDTSDGVVVIAEGLWRDAFGSDPAVLGQRIICDGSARIVIGVMPGTFVFPSSGVRIWTPLTESWRNQPRNARFLGAVGRLTGALTLEAARDDLRGIARALEHAHPATNKGWGVTMAPLQESLVGDVKPALIGLLGAVACVLLIACANVASLLLARGVSRSREFAVRAAVGASRVRLFRQQLVESTILAAIGGGLGIVLAAWALGAARSAPGVDLPLLDRVAIDARTLAATVGLTMTAILLAAAVPAWRSSRAASAALAAGTRATRANINPRRAVVFGQIVLATILLAAGALLLKSFTRLTAVPTGFAADRTLLSDVSLPASRYARDARAPMFDRILDRLRQAPGIEAAGAGGPMPLSGQEGLLRFGVRIEGRPAAADRPDRIYLRWATSDYFRAMAIPQLSGRAFSGSDTAASVPVAVVDEAFARRFLDGTDPIGQRIQLSNERTTSRVVVGVVGSVRQTALDRSADPHVYVPQSQFPSPSLTLVVRSTRDTAEVITAVRAAVREADAELPLGSVRTLAELVSGSTAAQRTNTMVLSIFAAAALVLTLVGVYGVVAQSIAQSTREIGIRLALGATTSEVARLTVRGTAALAAGGVAAGSAAAWFFAPALQGLLYGVSPRDPFVLIAAAGLLMLAVAAAAFVPARRILRLDVVNTLRAD